MLDALVVGANSFIGRHLLERLEADGKCVMGTSRWANAENKGRWIYCDLMTPALLPDARYTFLLAAVTGFKACADDPWTAEQVNVNGTVLIAQRQIDLGGRVMFVSSSAVEHEQVSLYGQLKLKAEEEILEYPGAAVIRFGPIKKPGRMTYPDKAYQPLEIEEAVDALVNLMGEGWLPGLHRYLRPIK